MRFLPVLATLFATTALADVGPRPPPCSVPKSCVTCLNVAGTPDDTCIGNATDAGLVLSDCSDRSGSSLSTYYCPKNEPAVRGCGCATTDVIALSALGVLVPALRRRRR